MGCVSLYLMSIGCYGLVRGFVRVWVGVSLSVGLNGRGWVYWVGEGGLSVGLGAGVCGLGGWVIRGVVWGVG